MTEEVKRLGIGDAITAYRIESNITQAQLAAHLHFDRSMLSKVENGQRKWPEEHDAKLSGLSWKLALQIADERSGGFISNILNEVPNLDLHPAALKDVLLKEIEDAKTALEGLLMAKHLDPAKRAESAKKVWHELRDVIEVAVVMQGVVEEEFRLDRRELIKQHERQLKNGER